jgi:hypothetical protein
MEKQITNEVKLIAFCGLYCAACGKYLNGKCKGCPENEKATWCAVRTCCKNNNYKSCADCKEFSNAMDCKKYNNFMSKVFGFIFRSDRNACIEMIKKEGYENFAKYMTENRLQSMKR